MVKKIKNQNYLKYVFQKLKKQNQLLTWEIFIDNVNNFLFYYDYRKKIIQKRFLFCYKQSGKTIDFFFIRKKEVEKE